MGALARRVANLQLYGSTLAAPRVPHAPPSGTRLHRWRLPSRLQGALLGPTVGADGFLGGCDLFHHSQYHRLPIRRAVEVATLHDCIFIREPELVGSGAAEGMARRARELAAHAARILVPSRYVQGQVSEVFQVDPERVRVTPLGCDHAVRCAPRAAAGECAEPGSSPVASPSGPYLLTVARIEPRKNHLRMLRAFEGVVAAGLPHRWIVAGPVGHGAEPFLEALRTSPARERVERVDEVSEARLQSLLSGAAAFLFTSLSEGFGLPPLEAMAHGVPVVASRTTSVGEVCAAGASLVDPLDVEGTRDALCVLLGDEAAQREGARRARERAAEFTWDRCAETTLAAYGSALGAEG